MERWAAWARIGAFVTTGAVRVALEHEFEGTNVGVTVLCPGPINTNITRGARNRPDHMGGPQIRAGDEAILTERLATTGLDPKEVGERAVDAIRTQTFYAFVGAVRQLGYAAGLAQRCWPAETVSSVP